VFAIDQVRFRANDGRPDADFFVVEAPDWVNVVPLTSDGNVVFVRQFRFGVEDVTLEIPGGMCDPGEAPAEAAARELEEETGYSGPLRAIGSVHPNPAIQSNRCWTFVASDVRRVSSPSPDPHEELEVVERPLEEIPELIRRGAITHSLVVTAFYLLGIAG
jgi:8-oxo-dGTP pyrophosphatase MutT (NUDIX family)